MPQHASAPSGVPLPPSLSRRRLLGAACAGAAAGAFLLTPLRPLWASSPDALDTFMAVSERLTGHDDLDGKLGESLYAALAGRDAAFAASLAGLQAGLATNPPALDEGQQARARTILSAWYLGLVGSGPAATVVSYRDALMFAPVAGALTPRASCFGNPGSWAEKPEPRRS